MVQGFNRSILAMSWGMLRQHLSKAATATEPLQVTITSRAYMSLGCSECEHTDRRNRESQAIFCCISCVHTTNAANNIFTAGLVITGRGGTPYAGSNNTPDSDQ
jgi:putative transposase